MTGPPTRPLNCGEQAMLDERLKTMRDLLARHGLLPLQNRRVLDVGCGHGHDLARLTAWGARAENMFGVDSSAERIEVARRIHPTMSFECGSAASLPFPDAHFDLVLMCTLMTSVLDEGVARSIAGSVSRVLRPGGRLLWYDFRYESPTNRRTRAVRRGELIGYFPSFAADFRTLTALPPISRRLGRLTPIVYPLLDSIPFLRTHYMAILTKPRAAERAA
jgi:ubiquinone/menaquinone biosynthesis C-methylase UbiE